VGSYAIEPIGPAKPQRSLADVISDAVDAGLSDAEIKAAVAKRKPEIVNKYSVSPVGHGRGDDLFQADPSPAPPITVGRRLPPTAPPEGGDVDLGKLGAGPAAAGAGMVSGTSFPGAPPADEGAEARGFMRFAAGGLAGQAAGGAARALGAGPGAQAIIGGAASGAAPTAMAGGSPTAVAKDALIGAAVPTVGAMLKGAGQAVLNGKGGRARALLERHGANVGVADSGSGLPELDAVKGRVSDADIGATARESGRKLLDVNDRTFDAEGRQPYKRDVAQIDKGQGRNLVDVLPLRRKMLEVAGQPDTDPAVRNVLVGQVQEMDAAFPDTGMGRRYAPEAWVNGKTSWLWKQAKPDRLASGAGTPRDAKFADVAAVGQDIREKGPYADANKRYATAKQESGDFREALGAKRAPSADETIDERKIANALARRGQTTTTAGIQGGDKRLADLVAAHPDLQRTVDAPELVRAKGDLQFRLGGPHHGGLIDRVAGPAAGLAAGAGAAIAGHGGMAGAAALGAYALGQNTAPIAGRVLYPAAPGAAALGSSMQGAGALTSQFSALQAAADQKKQRDAAVIQTLFGSQPSP
jgi:hypothetical protein